MLTSSNENVVQLEIITSESNNDKITMPKQTKANFSELEIFASDSNNSEISLPMQTNETVRDIS